MDSLNQVAWLVNLVPQSQQSCWLRFAIEAVLLSVGIDQLILNDSSNPGKLVVFS